MTCPVLRKAEFSPVSGPVLTIVMDGVGIGQGDNTDAVAQAHTPYLDFLATHHLHTQLNAHGKAVGMPSDDDMGNSEVGHNALGAGRIFDQGAKLVSHAIEQGSVFEHATWKQWMDHCRSGHHTLHFLGLLSDGNVHSHIQHLFAMLERAAFERIPRVRIHVLLDGRDVPRASAHLYLEQLQHLLTRIQQDTSFDYAIASGGGRMKITMDRYEADWPMVERGYRTHVYGDARPFASAEEALATLREETPHIGDQELDPFVVVKNGQPVGPILDGDAVIGFNFRGDRMLEITRAFEDPAFNRFTHTPLRKVLFAGMTLYDGDTHCPKHYLVSPPAIECTLSEVLCTAGISQLACSETQKYGHVTYFWNGNKSGMFDPRLETYIEIPSLQGPFNGHPAMCAAEITQAVAHALRTGAHRFARVNFANGDMVGHTGDFNATVEAVQAVDLAVRTLAEQVLSLGGAVIVTADHGNADDMVERNKKTGALTLDPVTHQPIPKTSHSLNPVPFYVVLNPHDAGRFQLSHTPHAGLGNVAATITTLLGFQQPEHFLPSMIHHRHTHQG
jgi:2,3-bisphosphoglycerate-independent phosphoglycerate mutase